MFSTEEAMIPAADRIRRQGKRFGHIRNDIPIPESVKFRITGNPSYMPLSEGASRTVHQLHRGFPKAFPPGQKKRPPFRMVFAISS
jgi:hypothetical protein